MDLQTYLNNAVKVARDGRFSQSDQLSLGELILKIEPIAERMFEEGKEPEVYYDFEYLFPTSINSWRGIYAELALDFTSHDIKPGANPMKVSEFLKMLKDCIGKTFEGYKGGDYVMGKTTPIWVSNWGNSGDTAVVDVVDDGYQVILITAYREP